MTQDNEDELTTLINDYCMNVPIKLEAIVELWIEAQNNWNEHSLDKLKYAIHNLHGSAGTFGFKKLSEVGAKFEGFLNTISDVKVLNPKIIAEMNRYIEELKVVALISEKVKR